jgi:tRNA nucleotidyltransferase (CCA-adding enzyme)
MQSVYILHEGNAKNTHDSKLIKLLISHLKEEYTEIYPDIIEYHGMGSKSNFFKIESYPALLTQGVNTNQVKKVLFVVDADDVKNDSVYGGFENTNKGLDEIIAELEFQAVSSTYIMCDPNTKAGYLESFILSTIPEQQKACIERFLECSQFKSKENHKAILNQIYNMAYPDSPYDFKHSHFDELKTKLIWLFAGS